jgi:hypothetical protein
MIRVLMFMLSAGLVITTYSTQAATVQVVCSPARMVTSPGRRPAGRVAEEIDDLEHPIRRRIVPPVSVIATSPSPTQEMRNVTLPSGFTLERRNRPGPVPLDCATSVPAGGGLSGPDRDCGIARELVGGILNVKDRLVDAVALPPPVPVQDVSTTTHATTRPAPRSSSSSRRAITPVSPSTPGWRREGSRCPRP